MVTFKKSGALVAAILCTFGTPVSVSSQDLDCVSYYEEDADVEIEGDVEWVSTSRIAVTELEDIEVGARVTIKYFDKEKSKKREVEVTIVGRPATDVAYVMMLSFAAARWLKVVGKCPVEVTIKVKRKD